MEYKVEYTAVAVKTLKKIGKPIRALIYGWIEKILLSVQIPSSTVKSLQLITRVNGDIVGDYRILAEIKDTKVTILIVTIGHRKEIYK